MQIARGSEVTRAVQFNRKLLLRAIKIQNEFANAVLAAKFTTG